MAYWVPSPIIISALMASTSSSRNMSIIHKALQKAQQDRQQQQAGFGHSFATTNTHQSPQYIWPVLLIIVLIFVAGYIWFRSQTHDKTDAIQPPISKMSDQTDPAKPETLKPIQQTKSPSRPANPVPDEGIEDKQLSTVAEPTPPQESIPVSNENNEPNDPDSIHPGSRAAESIMDKSAKETNITPIHLLPADIRTKLGKLNLSVIYYDEDPARAFVLINMKRHATGDTVASTFLLHSIKSDAVLLQYQEHLIELDND